jgi:hypothetical protein
MKTIKYIIITAIIVVFSACNEEQLLEEKPLDFLSPANAYVEPEHFESAIYNIYGQFRSYFADNSSSGDFFTHFIWGTDVAHHARNPEEDGFGNYTTLNSQTGLIRERWSSLYSIVFNANVIIERIEAVEFPNDVDKSTILAEAYFFRAMAYRMLGHLWGGVPIVLEEITTPRRDFVRASYNEVFLQVESDLEFAIANLPEIDDVQEEGRISKAAAQHLMTEVQITLDDNDAAIAAATAVIGNPKFALMTERFGSRANEPGDVYWDLFRLNNQNRSAGNTEGIWVMQVEYNVPGGYGMPDGDARFYERTLLSQYNRILGADKKYLFFGPSTYHGGRGQGYIRPTRYYFWDIWGDDFDSDMRNSEYNILRKFNIDNPASQYFGQTLDLTDPSYRDFIGGSDVRKDTLQYIYPGVMKIAMINNHFPSEFQDGSSVELAGSARRTYLDWYAMRLAETYLLRAEAYLNKGMLAEAAGDINTVRDRAGATPIDAADVDIDIILDERARELFMEEPRRVTLARLGLLYERTKAHNPFAGAKIQPHNNLWPIPFTEIERNTQAELVQNDGYL